MPNICTGFMNVRGYAPNVDEFIKILQANYSYYKDSNNGDYTWCADPKNFTHTPHFFRVFEANLMDNPIWHSGVYKTASISFECAWSAYSCMFDGPHTYYSSYQIDHPNQHFASHILAESKRLQLEIEIWTSEYGMSFQEHYKICSGILVKEEEYNFNTVVLELNDYNTYNEFLAACGNHKPNYTEAEFNNLKNINDTYWFEEGYHEEELDFSPEDKPIYLANIVMCKLRED